MRRRLLLLSYALLFLCTSMYLGTGWSLLLFSFPIAPELTVDDYYLQFVPQVTAATQFFTYMTILMLGLAGVMLVAEWRTRYRWVPIAVLAGVVAATGLTMAYILPYNEEMSAGITDPDRLRAVLDRWMMLNRVRVGLWTVQWLALMAYFTLNLLEGGKRDDETRLAVHGAGGGLGGDRDEWSGAAPGA